MKRIVSMSHEIILWHMDSQFWTHEIDFKTLHKLFACVILQNFLYQKKYFFCIKLL